VFVIPSDALATPPAYVSSSANTMFLDYGLNVTLNGSNVITAYAPASYMFVATDGSNHIHVYGLNLASSTIPMPTQLSSLSLPLTSGAALDTVICDFHGSSSNILQPTTAFVVLHIAGATGCNTTGDVYEVVHYTDTSATAPAVVSITTTDIRELYAPSGALTGLVLLDPASGNVYLYANDGFTTPSIVITGAGITSIGTVYSGNSLASSGAAFTGTNLFLSVTKTNGVQYLYRLPYTATAATLEYTAAGSLTLNGPSDGTNVYFADTSAGATTQTIWQEPLDGGATTELYSYTVPTGGQPYQLIGSNGSLLVISGGSTNGGTGVLTSALATLPVGTLSTNTTALGSSYTGVVSAFMGPTTPGTPSTDLVFVDVFNLSSNPTVYSYSSEVLSPSGTVTRVRIANSYFLENSISLLSGSVLQLTGIDDNVGGEGGAAINALNIGTQVATPLKTSSGTTYTVPAGSIPGLVGESSVISAGVLEPVAAGFGNPAGLAVDLSKSLIVPIRITNTSVALF